MGPKSMGLCPQGFESPRCRLCDPVFFPISTILPCTWPAMPGRGSDSRSASGLRPRLSQQVIAMAVIAQLVARRSHNPKVVSSILTHRMVFAFHCPIIAEAKRPVKHFLLARHLECCQVFLLLIQIILAFFQSQTVNS